MTNPMQKARAALVLHPKCGAYCRTTGKLCKNSAMGNGRCRMHGGKSTGRPITNGCYTKEAKLERKEVRRIVRELRELMET